VVHDVGRLVDGARAVSISARRHQLGRLLTDLLEAQVAVGEQSSRIARLLPRQARWGIVDSGGDRGVERAEYVCAERLFTEARARSRVTRRARRAYAREHGIAITVG
jgi:hypothetical protein